MAKIVSYGHFLFICSDTCCRMYLLAIVHSHSITDSRTDRRHNDDNSRWYCTQYDWLEIMIDDLDTNATASVVDMSVVSCARC